MKNKPENKNQIPYLPICMSIGLSIGVAIGAGIDNIPMCMCIGMAIGVGIGSALDAKERQKKSDEPKEETKETDL